MHEFSTFYTKKAHNECNYLTIIGQKVPGGTTSAKVKSLIHTELAIFLLVTIAHSHHISHCIHHNLLKYCALCMLRATHIYLVSIVIH